MLAYCVSKAGVDQLTRCLALELAADGVRVNAVNPGVVRTNSTAPAGWTKRPTRPFWSGAKRPTRWDGSVEPEEVADLIAFLGSSRAGWITGETIAIDGGRAQTCNR